MSAIVCCEKPCVLSDENASSRFGPIVPLEPASPSVWQLAHEPLEVFARNSCLPCATSPWPTRPTAPQPVTSAADARRRAAGARTVFSALRAGLGDAVELRDRLVAGSVDREDAVEAGDLEDLGDVAVAAHERQLA